MLVLAIRSPLLALATVPSAQLQNELRFKLLSLIQLVVAVVVMALTILFALILPPAHKAQAFVLPLLAGAVLRAGVLFVVAPPPLKANFEWRTWQMLAGSSAILFSANFFFTLTSQGDYLTLGRLQSEYVQGIYFFAFNLTLQTTQFLTVNLSGVLFPALSKLQNDPARQRRAFLRATDMLMLLGVPLCLLQAALAAPAVHLFFPRWAPAIGVLQCISVGMSLQLVNMPAMGMIQAQGRFKTLLALSIFCAAFFLGIVFLAAHSGHTDQGLIQWPWLKGPLEALMGAQANVAVVVALAVTLYCAIIGPTCIYTAIRPVGGTWSQIAVIYLRPLAMSVVAIAVGLLVCWRLPPSRLGDGLRLAGVSAIAAAVYVPAMRRLARSSWDVLVERLSEMVR
jgi:PST family polysaccharide transporter